MAGNLALLLNGIGVAVTFTILLVVANTMSIAVRERRKEIGVLKTLGFPSRLVLWLVLAESLVIALLGGGLGLLLGWGGIHLLTGLPMLGPALAGYPSLGLTPSVALGGMGIALLLGALAGVVPAMLAFRANITEALRTV